MQQTFLRELKPSREVELEQEGGALAAVRVEAVVSSDGLECWATMTDITQHKVAESALLESETRYRTLVAQTPFRVHEIDMEERFVSDNRDYSGKSKVGRGGEPSETAYLDDVSKMDLPRDGQLLSAAMDGEASRFEFASDGEPKLFFMSCFVPIRCDANKMIRVLMISENVTERRLAEDVIRTSNQRLEALQSIGKLGGWELDLTTSRLFWTAETYRIYDTSPEMFNPTIDTGVSYFLPESRAIITDALEAAVERSEGYGL
ncbi:MAG: PAS domain-containing protein, partial [Gammaproteobacteria bacterium]